MAHLHLLGTGAALADAGRTTTMLAFEADSVVVMDCGGDVVQGLLKAGIDLDRIALLILSHEHPDHVGGFPLFMEKIWLAGRRRPIPVCGPERALDQAKRIFESFDTRGWTGMPTIDWRPVALDPGARVWEDDEWRITAAPGRHSVPVIGVRVDDRRRGGSVACSADTEPTGAIERLAEGVDILVHEATGGPGKHSSAGEAAEVARRCGAKRLVLVHLPAGFGEAQLREARAHFEPVEAGQDGSMYIF